jgi:hypothetical protein
MASAWSYLELRQIATARTATGRDYESVALPLSYPGIARRYGQCELDLTILG